MARPAHSLAAICDSPPPPPPPPPPDEEVLEREPLSTWYTASGATAAEVNAMLDSLLPPLSPASQAAPSPLQLAGAGGSPAVPSVVVIGGGGGGSRSGDGARGIAGDCDAAAAPPPPAPARAFRVRALCLGFDAAFKKLRATVSQEKRRFILDGFDLDLTYITPQIIAMGFPSTGREIMFRNPLPEVVRFFETRHAGRYRIYNLCSERAYPASEFAGRVARFPFDDHNPCPLELIPRFCADVHAWLAGHPANVAAIHCKAGKGRTGLLVSAYLLHAGRKRSAEEALRFFGAKRTRDTHGVTIPSQMRYVHYYEKMLKYGAPPVGAFRLRWLRFRTVPSVDASGGCTPYFELFCGERKAFDYRAALATLGDLAGRRLALRRYKAGELFVDFDLSLFNICIASDVRLQCWSHAPKTALCHLWFHTGFVARNYLYFGRHVIDGACKERKGVFTPFFAIELFLDPIGASDS